MNSDYVDASSQYQKREEHFNRNFFANSVVMNFHGSTISMDFLCNAPRSTNLGPAEVVEHNVVILDIHHAKRFATLINDWIGGIESKHGQIGHPDFIKSLETKEVRNAERPNYLG